MSAYILQEGDDSKQSDNEDMFRVCVHCKHKIIINYSNKTFGVHIHSNRTFIVVFWFKYIIALIS